MENSDPQIIQLKANLYDAKNSIDSLNALLTRVVNASGIDTEEGITEEDIIERIEYLASLENKKSKKSK